MEPQSNGTVNLSQLNTNASNGKLSNGKMYSYIANSDIESDREGTATWAKIGTYREPLDSIQHRRLPELPRTPESTGRSLAKASTPIPIFSPLFFLMGTKDNVNLIIMGEDFAN